jgi:hypothetical protein
MPLNLEAFRAVANSATITSRDIEIQGQGENASARLGAYFFSAGKKSNDAVMSAFKAALENEYGVFGTHAFDMVLGSRQQMHKSLRACDVKAALSKLDAVKQTRYIGELNRQLDTNPKFRTLAPELRQKIRNAVADAPFEGVAPEACKSQAELARLAVKRLDAAISANRTGDRGENVALDGRKKLEEAAGGREPTGLRNLKKVFDDKDTSIEDKIKQGKIGTGMRVNRSNTSPVLLDKLKTNGVEPGFIFRNDWSKDDTHGFMADINSPGSLRALEELKEKNPQLRTDCEGKSLREQIMLAGRAHPAGVAAAAEYLLERAVDLALNPNPNPKHPFMALARALREQFSVEDLQRLKGAVSEPRNKDILKEAKLELFTEIRDTVMSIGPKGDTADFYKKSPVFKHFSDRAIMKLDYNEGDKLGGADSASAGKFRRPERILATRGALTGPIYRFTSRQSADKISAGAVTEALANDLTRLAGVPSQELEIVRGSYSDGHPKIMLSAKFADGYRDMEDKMLKDGRAVAPPRGKGKNAPPPPEPEPLGKYKAFFLLTADRDGVGKRGQNKGFIKGKFFAIDPGHSLEGNGKYLDISDDFSFKDTFGVSLKPRFDNFSVFDDDTRSAKLSGLIELRETARSGAFEKLFQDYKDAFDPKAPGISEAEKKLRTRICAEIDEKKAEFDQQFARLMKIFDPQLKLHDALAARGPAVQEGAINTLSHLEMLTSPTTWVSKHGEVALKHLEVRPETRIPWRAEAVGNDIVYHCDKPLDGSVVTLLETLAADAGVRYEYDNWGNSRLVVPQEAAEKFFAVFSEQNVQKLTHPEEYMARTSGTGDPLAVAKDYTPRPFRKVADPRPPLTAEQLPAELDVVVGGKVVRMPKVHYERMATTRSSVSRPRSVGDLRASLEARIRRGNDILRALLSGNTELFEPTRDNIAALTHALHAAALKKGEFMYRGSFSVADPDGNVARWLDKAENLYLRTSTHARPYHGLTVDGHRNMPRGYDVPEGMGGLLNGMRTFHYFTIPDSNGLAENGGSGPRRRLFLKCETFGIYCSTAHFHPFGKADATTEGMSTRSYRPGDIIESIFHGSSLFVSYFTDKEADGIRKENLLEATKEVVQVAEANLKAIGEDRLAQILMTGVTDKGAGVRQLMDNMTAVLENLPADENKRAEVTEILDDMVEGILRTTGHLTGEIAHRMGNEIMIDPQDLL